MREIKNCQLQLDSFITTALIVSVRLCNDLYHQVHRVNITKRSQLPHNLPWFGSLCCLFCVSCRTVCRRGCFFVDWTVNSNQTREKGIVSTDKRTLPIALLALIADGLPDCTAGVCKSAGHSESSWLPRWEDEVAACRLQHFISPLSVAVKCCSITPRYNSNWSPARQCWRSPLFCFEGEFVMDVADMFFKINALMWICKQQKMVTTFPSFH